MSPTCIKLIDRNKHRLMKLKINSIFENVSSISEEVRKKLTPIHRDADKTHIIFYLTLSNLG